MVSAPRCPPGARGLLALLLLLPLPGARGECGALPRVNRAVPRDTSQTEGFPIHTEVTYKCSDGLVKIPGKSDTVVCLSNSEWSNIGEFCNGACGAPPRLKSAALSKEDERRNYCPPGTTVSYVCRPGYESTELRHVVTCLESLIWSEAPEFCREKSCGVPKGPEHGRAVNTTDYLYGARVNIICDDGFRLRGRPFIQCTLKGDQVEWSQLPTCEGIECKPLELENGRVPFTDLRFGATANFSCNEGYRLNGPTSAQCVVAGNGVDWDKELPLCEEIPCLPPPDITHGSHTGQSEQEFSFGSAVTYKCDQGFSLIGEASIHCTTKDNLNGEWSGPAPECKRIECKPLELENGRVPFTDLRFGATANFSCNEGYRLNGPTSAQCVVAGNGVDWDKELPLCEEIPCLPPPDITHGSHTGQSEQEFSFGSAVTYKCDQGFSLIGEASIHCTTKDNLNGEWSGPAPECKRIECKPLELENGRVPFTDLRFGATANFSCNEGYRLNGPTSAQCVVAGNGVDWDKELPLCEEIPCLPPPDITHGSHTGQSEQEFSFGSAVTYKCDQGFSLIGEASIHCTTKDNLNGEWSGPAPECKRIECKPLELENGRVPFTDLRFGATANFSCNEGYRLNGPTSAQCVVAGNGVDWDKELPLCEEIPCLPPPDITHGSHTGQSEQEFSFGSAVTYKCDQGFSLIGEASIHCTTKDNLNGEWSGPAPECKRRPCKQLELENGRVHFTDLQFGATANFSCNEGYRLIGPNSVQCVVVGNGVDWDKELPLCQVVITQDKPTTVPPKGTEVAGTSSVVITQDKPTTVPPEETEVAGTSSGRIIDTLIVIVIVIVIIIVSMVVNNCTGICAALNKKWKKKKGCYSVNPDSPKHQITTEHYFDMNESKRNLIFKV